jgi:tetratricopeptide (TPR) repeat protein
LGKHTPAIEDLDMIIRLNPKFHQARLQKGKILAKEGLFEEGRDEVEMYLKEIEKRDENAVELVSRLIYISLTQPPTTPYTILPHNRKPSTRKPNYHPPKNH